MTRSIDILGFGEPLMEFAEQRGPDGPFYKPGHGGDTSNAVIAAARQGARCAYFTAVGRDAFGASFLELWDREGVDRSAVIERETARTGIYFITYGPKGHEFSYWRAGSAASLVTPAEVPVHKIAAARVLHVSGISQAISTSAADAVFHAIQVARANGTAVCYDTNLRLALWPLERARAVIMAGVAMADIARPGLDDARKLTGLEAPEAICDHFLALGPRIVALTLGHEGTMVATPERRVILPVHRVKAVDATAAGDTFGGAFLAEWLATGDPFQAAAHGNAAAALSTLGWGAVAPMPTRAAVEAFLRG